MAELAERVHRAAVVIDAACPGSYWRPHREEWQYNRRNPFCDGCEEPGNAGLSVLGRRLIAELNRLGIVVDVSHTGVRSALEAIEASSAPCIASHANAHAVHAHRRNLPDELIKAIAASGGVIGMDGYPAFVAAGLRPTLGVAVKRSALLRRPDVRRGRRPHESAVTGHMQHAAREAGKTEEEARAMWRELAAEYQRFWSEIFIPNLVELVHEGRVSRTAA